MNDWLSEFEESNRVAQEVRNRRVSFSSKEYPRDRMARVLRELAEVAHKAEIVMNQCASVDMMKCGTISRFAVHNTIKEAFDKLSDDAKELCITARDRTEEITGAEWH